MKFVRGIKVNRDEVIQSNYKQFKQFFVNNVAFKEQVNAKLKKNTQRRPHLRGRRYM